MSSICTSVALCTFDGERFLPEQLDSLRNQSRLPDEVVVCDDGSTDQTISILETFANSAPFPVTIHRNEATLGPAQNFAKAISLCTGDIICCCDQDDIWEAKKLEVNLVPFEQNSYWSYVFSDALICDATCAPAGYRLWKSVGFARGYRSLFDMGMGWSVLMRQNVVTGATLCFRASYRGLILPIPAGWMHDGWIALLLSAVGHGKAIREPLLRYRQHLSQSVGAQKRSLYQQFLNAKLMDVNVFKQQADAYEAALTRLQEQTDFRVFSHVPRALQQKIHHYRRRSAVHLRQTPRIPAIATEMITGRYNRFSLGWKSLAQDLFL